MASLRDGEAGEEDPPPDAKPRGMRLSWSLLMDALTGGRYSMESIERAAAGFAARSRAAHSAAIQTCAAPRLRRQ